MKKIFEILYSQVVRYFKKIIMDTRFKDFQNKIFGKNRSKIHRNFNLDVYFQMLF